MKKVRTLTVPVIAALVFLGASCAFWTTKTARSAMSDQVIASETAAAVERAEHVADSIDVAHERLVAATSLVGARLALERGDVAFLRAAVRAQTQGRGITRITVTGADGQVLAVSPDDRPAIFVADDATHIEAAGAGHASLVFRAPFRNDTGDVIGWLHEEQSLDSLVPSLVTAVPANGAQASLVTESGQVLASGNRKLGARFSSPELLRLVRSKQPKGATFHSDELGTDRIGASAPVPGHPWSVVVDVDASAANKPAGSLVARLLGAFLLTGLLAAALLLALGTAVVRARRSLQEAHDRSRQEAMTDSLTGVYNRRAFDERLATLRDEAGSVGIAVVDINDLKGVNDVQGHLAGDGLIKEIAEVLEASVRANDTVFRIGGDEFAVVVPSVRPGEMDQVAARIHDAVATRASVGAADSMSGDVDAAFRQADIAMYAAKRRVESH
jgi:diguanylate cyclase (GGDEF)-like protein